MSRAQDLANALLDADESPKEFFKRRGVRVRPTWMLSTHHPAQGPGSIGAWAYVHIDDEAKRFQVWGQDGTYYVDVYTPDRKWQSWGGMWQSVNWELALKHAKRLADEYYGTNERVSRMIEADESPKDFLARHANKLHKADPYTLDTFTKAYMEAGLWASTDDNDDPLDSNYGFGDFDQETLRRIVKECARFQSQHWDLISHNLERAGHDFFLTRNRHGAGFWDGDWGEFGDRLTEAAHAFGESNLYVGDDGKIYAY